MRLNAPITLLATLSAACGLAACGLLGGVRGLDSARMPAAVNVQFPGGGKAPLPDQWWRSFRSGTLNSLIERALRGNLGLAAARDRITQAQAVARREGVELWPAVDALAGGSRTRETLENMPVRHTSRRAVNFSATYELDLWGRIRANRDAARLDAEAIAADWQAAALALSANVASAWFQLVEQYGQVDLARGQRETNAKVLELVNVRYEKGRVDAADVLRQRQLLESSNGNLAIAESRAAVLEHALAILLGEPPGVRVAPRTTSLPPLPPLPSAGVPAELIQRRPDLRAAWLDVLAADRRLAAAKAERFPKLALSAGVDTSSARVRDLFDNWLATVAASLIAPVIDGGARQAEVERTRAVVSQRLNTYGQAVLSALGEVRDALVQERQQRAFLASLDQQLTLARQTLSRNEDSYTKGAVDYLRVLESLASMQSLERDVLTARRELAGFRIDLCRSLSGGWTDSGVPLKPQQP